MGLSGLAAVVTGLVAAAAQTQAEPRFELVSFVRGGDAYTADVWAHRGHAYLSSHVGAGVCPSDGIRIYSLVNPAEPRYTATFADARSEPEVAGTFTEKTIVRRVATASFTGDVAVTSFQRCTGSPGFQGFGVYDVTDPEQPRRLALVATRPAGSHEIWLAAARGRAWVYTPITRGETAQRPGFRIFDVTNPRRPRQVGSWGAQRALGIGPGDGILGRPIPFNIVHSVITNAAATRAFVSYWDLGTVILDIANPAKPRYLGRTSFRAGEAGNAHSAWLFQRERLMFQTHETAHGIPLVYDVSNPRRPRRIGSFDVPESVKNDAPRTSRAFGFVNSVHNATVAGNVAYFSWYNQGVVAADITDPRRPKFLARFLPAATRESGICESRCSVTLGIAAYGDLVIASDFLSGMWVLRLVR